MVNNTNELVETLLHHSIQRSHTRMGRWGTARGRISQLNGRFEFAMDVQDIGHIDCILVGMEDDQMRSQRMHAHAFLHTLSRMWIGQSYELLRAIKQRIVATKKEDRVADWNEDMADVFGVLEACRTMLFKREQAGAGKKGKGPTILPQIDADGMPTEPYIHGKSVLSQHVFSSPQDNSVGWLIYGDRYPPEGQVVFRRLIADDLLTKLEVFGDRS